MQVRVERVTEADRAERVVGVVLAVLAGMLLLCALACLIFLLGMHLDSSRTAPTWSADACCLLFGVSFPLLGFAASLWGAWRSFQRARGLETILRTLRPDGTLDEAALAARLGDRRAERARIDALAAGALVPLAAGTSVRPPEPSRAWEGPYVPPTAQGASHRPPPAPSPAIAPMVFPPAPLPSTTPARATPYGANGPLSPALAHTTPMAAVVPDLASVRPPAGSAGESHPPAVDIVGRTLKGTWFVENRLAAGGMGAVHVARHVRTGRRYALKTMLPDERLSVEAIHRFEREAKAASAIGHAGIVGVHDFDREGPISFIVMDLLEGETLEDRLARAGRLGWPDVKRIALEVADALAAAHRAGVMHRDLKPSNVFLARREGAVERAVLVDFGLAKPIREGAGTWVTRTGAIVGTAHYMSPEQARGERVDVRTDVYGLCAVVYEMIAGVPPFLGSTAFAVMTMLLTEQPVAPSQLVPGVPPALDALLLQGLAKDANQRPADVSALANALAAIP